MKSFLQQTAQSIVAHIEWSQLSNTKLVLPTQSARLGLKNERMRLHREQNCTAR